MSDYEARDVRVGMACAAPMKRGDKRTRAYEAVEVVRIDGNVVEVKTTGKLKQLRSTFVVGALRRPGTKTPPMGVVL